MRERPIAYVPKFVVLLLTTGFILQIVWRLHQPAQPPRTENLTSPPSLTALKIASFGEPIALARFLMLDLQAFDHQTGTNMTFRKLDYLRLQTWLGRILDLDPQGQYPLTIASRVYAAYTDPLKQRQMLEFIYQRFLEDPNRRWPWLAQAALTAKHDLKDLPLAKKYAHAIRTQATGNTVPSWAKQMEIFLLEDMNELESAKFLLGGLLYSGKITDARELRFLQARLAEMERKMQHAK